MAPIYPGWDPKHGRPDKNDEDGEGPIEETGTLEAADDDDEIEYLPYSEFKPAPEWIDRAFQPLSDKAVKKARKRMAEKRKKRGK